MNDQDDVNDLCLDASLIHVDHVAVETSPLTMPIYLSTKFTTQSLEEFDRALAKGREGFVYSRLGNPTVRTLEKALAKAQGREDAVCTASGVAAISGVLLSVLKAGDQVVMFYESYKPTRFLVRNFLAKFGVAHRILFIDDKDAIAAAIREPATKLVVFETPSNPMTRSIDLAWLCDLARSNGVLTLMDNTFAGIHQHSSSNVDIFVHSLSKFVGGHGDVLAGAIIADKKSLQPIWENICELGPALDAHAAYLCLRGLRTYGLRYRTQSASAHRIAERLESNPHIKRVYYPGLPSHPDHATAKRQMSDFGAIIAIDVQTSVDIARVISSCSLFKLAASLGGTESLIAPSEKFYGGDLTSEEKRRAGITPQGLRLAIGLEGAEVLIADLEAALANAV